MDPLVLGTATAFGLSASAGLNTTLPLLLVGLLSRFNLISLNAPFNALSSDVALGGLFLLMLMELVGDKVAGVDTVVQALQWPLAATAGGILFASQTSAVSWVHPGLAVIIGLLTAGAIHGARTSFRPAVTGLTLGLGNAAVSLIEDIYALLLAVMAVFMPLLGVVLALLLLAILLLGGRKVLGRVLKSSRQRG